jgi:hypothetical protein
MRFLAISIALACALSTSAEAGVFTDDLTRCLVSKATDSDRDAFMAWMFSAVSADPQLQKFTTLDRTKRDNIAATAADVFQRLIFVDCRKEAIAAMKAEGQEVLAQAFGGLGRAATEQMFQSPQAQAELEALGNNFDEAKLKALAAEAGIAEKKSDK